MPPESFPSAKLPNGQSNHLAGRGLEHLPRGGGRFRQRGRVGEVDERRPGKQGGAGGLLTELPAVGAQAIEPGGVGVFFSVRPWWAKRVARAAGVRWG